MSGYSSASVECLLEPGVATAFLKKPFTASELASALRKLLGE